MKGDLNGEAHASGARIGYVLTDLLQDLRNAGCALRQSPTLTLISVSSLALGIGAATSVYAITFALFFVPPAGVDPGRASLSACLAEWHRTMEHAAISAPERRNRPRTNLRFPLSWGREFGSCRFSREPEQISCEGWRREWESGNSVFQFLRHFAAVAQLLPILPVSERVRSRSLSRACWRFPVFAARWHSKWNSTAGPPSHLSFCRIGIA
jgi:hypothetical protein